MILTKISLANRMYGNCYEMLVNDKCLIKPSLPMT